MRTLAPPSRSDSVARSHSGNPIATHAQGFHSEGPPPRRSSAPGALNAAPLAGTGGHERIWPRCVQRPSARTRSAAPAAGRPRMRYGASGAHAHGVGARRAKQRSVGRHSAAPSTPAARSRLEGPQQPASSARTRSAASTAVRPRTWCAWRCSGHGRSTPHSWLWAGMTTSVIKPNAGSAGSVQGEELLVNSGTQT